MLPTIPVLWGNRAWLHAVLAISTSATISMTLLVQFGWTADLDSRVLDWSEHRHPPSANGKPRRWTTALRDLSALGGDTLRLLFLLGCMLGLLADDRPAIAGTLLAIFAFARLILFLLKAIVRRPRPDASGHGMTTYTSSFPSGHTFMTVVLFLSAAILIPSQSTPGVMETAIIFALVTSLAIGMVRMSFRLHWPSDIFAGWVGGIAWTSFCVLAIDRFVV